MCLKDNLQQIVNTPTVNDGNFYYVYDLCYNAQNSINIGAFLSSYTLAIAIIINNGSSKMKANIANMRSNMYFVPANITVATLPFVSLVVNSPLEFIYFII